MSKTMSPEQLAANRANAQKSTGPITASGRDIAKRNALKHGIFSQAVLVRTLSLRESSRKLSALHQRFRQELNPAGPLEELLVDQIVTTHWRLRRALAAESAEIALSVDENHWQRSRGQSPQLQWLIWKRHGDTTRGLRASAVGIELLEGWLENVRQSVKQEGQLTEAAIRNLAKSYAGIPNTLTEDLEELREALQNNPEGLDAAALRKRNQAQALEFLDEELASLRERKCRCEEWEKKQDAARQAAAVLPPKEALDKILRYETKLERQMFRAMAQLERLQRMRLGEAVPPPVTLEVSDRN
jgi:hypothetical protein